MKKYVCSVCGFIYDESAGIPEAGIAQGTKWEKLPDDWVCPLCGAGKPEFREEGAKIPTGNSLPVMNAANDMKELTPLEMSILCSNLARGCEKQYKAEEAALFTKLSDYYKSEATPAAEPSFNELLTRIENDLNTGFPMAKAVSSDEKDRGAQRALVWSEKVTRILKSLLARYEKDGAAAFENTEVYVCSICGFVFVGETPPVLCPVCKVPSWKFEKAEGRAM